VTDYGHRAVHEMTVKSKAVVSAFYGKPPRRAYFASCSNGGRQALMEAQRYPEDYDGIVAGAPAAAWTRFLFAFAWNTQALLRPGAHAQSTKALARPTAGS
jgi:pimeloyl-ACP methyl ester carboxylesterase